VRPIVIKRERLGDIYSNKAVVKLEGPVKSPSCWMDITASNTEVAIIDHTS